VIGYCPLRKIPKVQELSVPNPLLLFAAQIVAIFSVLLLAAGYLKTDPKAASARVFTIMAIFIVFYLLNGMSGPHIEDHFKLDLSSWRLVIQVGTSAICGLFMIYCFLIFQEQQRFPFTLATAFGLQIVLDMLLSILNLNNGPPDPASIPGLLATGMDVLQLVFVGFAIYWTLKGWRADLVDDRRVLRWFIIGVQGALIFTVVFIENFLLDGGSAAYATEQAAIVFAIAFLALAMLLVALRFDYVSLTYVFRKVTELKEETEANHTAEFDRESFERAFRDGQLYREAGLTIAMLAKKLNLPEYRLRAFIHNQLGYRNFNAMLHEYRIEDASNALADKSKHNVPVLTIALSVGYQSITPFNNAFRQLKGVTPSEYRKRHSQP
jgi:AraC-like DNA-binding protein